MKIIFLIVFRFINANGLRLEVVARFALKVQNLMFTTKPDKTFFIAYCLKKFLTGGLTMKQDA